MSPEDANLILLELGFLDHRNLFSQTRSKRFRYAYSISSRKKYDTKNSEFEATFILKLNWNSVQRFFNSLYADELTRDF